MSVAQIQVEIDTATNVVMDHNRSITYKKIRFARMQATLAIARWFAVAPGESAGFSVEQADGVTGYEDLVELVRWNWNRLETMFLKTALFGCFDFGWKAYEKEITFENTPVYGMAQIVDKLIPLKNDTTWQLRSEDGHFMGLKITQVNSGREELIDVDHSLFVSMDDEGLNDYGQGRVAVALEPVESWMQANEAAKRYASKIAGAHWFIWYPKGKTKINADDAEETDNADIAATIGKMLKASGTVTIPVDVSKLLDILNGSSPPEGFGWKIELKEAGMHAADYTTQLKYYDQLIMRAAGVPERTMTEGTYGTKAEAGEHAAVALLIRELEMVELALILNKYVVNQITRLNAAVEDVVVLKSKPLSDERRAIFEKIFMSMIADPNIGPAIVDRVNVEEVMDVLRVPVEEEILPDEIESLPITPPLDDAGSMTPPLPITEAAG